MKNDIWVATLQASLLDLSPEPDPAQELTPVRWALLDAKVMMVDDEPLMTDLIQTHLEDEGYSNFVVTNDPLEALAMLRREDPGVLLLDLMMPKLSGFELLEAMRADPALRYTPVIVLTAATGADSKLRALQLGATDFLSKPVDASELVLRVRNTLAFREHHARILNHDAATGLPNERLFDRGLDEMLSRRDIAGGLVALLTVHVPDLRQLSESLGQSAAGALAQELGRRLGRLADECNPGGALTTARERAPRIARLDSEHFGVLLESQPDVEAVENFVKMALAALAAPVFLGAHEVSAGAWVGIALAPHDGDSAEALRKGSSLAASDARARGAAPYQFASAALHARSHERLALGSQLRGAALRDELRLHYQPKVNLADGCIVGVEALVRWQHPEHGLIAPGRFIALAEELGLIRTIGQWVIERACRDAAEWALAGLGQIHVAVNVSKPQFVAGDLCEVLRHAMLDTGMPPGQIVIELTESMLMDDAQAGLDQMHDLKALGVTLSIDDFGTGYSSLSYLKRFPLDELKIDRSFVMDLPGGTADRAIVQTIVDLGHNLGMSIIAEGVETAEQLACLKELGCERYQGYLFSKPLPAPEFVALLKRLRASTA